MRVGMRMMRWVDMGVGGMERTMDMTEGVCERVRVGHGLSLLLLARGSDGPDMVHVALAHVQRLRRGRRWGPNSVAVAVSWDRVGRDVAERVGPVSVAHGIPFSFALAHLPLPHGMIPFPLFALAVVEVAHSDSFTFALSFSEIFVPGTAGPSLTRWLGPGEGRRMGRGRWC